MKIKGNPISIRKGGKVIGVHHVSCETFHPPVTLTAYRENDEEIFNSNVAPDSFNVLNAEEGFVRLIYRDMSQNIIKSEIIDFNGENRPGHQDSEEVAVQKKQQKTRMDRLTDVVKEEMDHPTGTPEEIEAHTDRLNRCTIDEDARHYVEAKIRGILSKESSMLEHELDQATKEVYANLYGMGILQEIDDNPEVGEIMVNGFIYPKFRSEIYYVIRGEKIRFKKEFNSFEDLYNVYSRAIAFSKKELNSVEHAMVEATRSNRDRVNIIIPDASESYVMNIRKFGNFVPNLGSMKEYGTVDDTIDRMMDVLVRGKANIGIGGEMGTGKTTFINYLLTYTEKIERKVVVASVSETDIDRVLKGHDVIILNADDDKGFTFSRLLKASLRTTASRIIVPESRGEEFKQVYEANLKTKGNMFTAHALDDYSFLDMCVDMYMGDSDASFVHTRNKIAKSMDFVIIMRKAGKDIRIKSISEVVTDENREFSHMNCLYEWVQDKEDPAKGHYRRTKNRMTEDLKNRLNEYGVPASELEGL